MTQFSTIWLLQDLLHQSPTSQNIIEITRKTKIHIDQIIQILTESNPMIVNLTRENAMQKVTSVRIEPYTVSYFARYLENQAEKQIIAEFKGYLFKKTTIQVMEELATKLSTNALVIQLLIYISSFKPFSAGQDAVIKLDPQKAITLMTRQGRSRLEAKWRIGRMLNLNLFDVLEVDFMLQSMNVSVLPQTIEALQYSGPDFRFAVELIDFYLKKDNKFWSFPADL